MILQSILLSLFPSLYIAWLVKLMVSRNADTFIPEISSDKNGSNQILSPILKFSFYEQLKLPFLTNLTEGVVHRLNIGL